MMHRSTSPPVDLSLITIDVLHPNIDVDDECRLKMVVVIVVLVVAIETILLWE